MFPLNKLPKSCVHGFRIVALLALLTMGCRTWRPGWLAQRRDAIQETRYVDEPAAVAGPAVVGEQLGLRPGETAADLALKLTQRLERLQNEKVAVDTENKRLREQRAETRRKLNETQLAVQDAYNKMAAAQQELTEKQKVLDSSQALITRLTRLRNEDHKRFGELLQQTSKQQRDQSGNPQPDANPN